MPDPDLQEPEADQDEFEGIEYPEDEAPVEEPEEPVEEEATEPSEEAEGEPEPAPEPTDDVPDLSIFPEEMREQAKQYADRRIGNLQKSWQEKLDAAAELRKQQEALSEKATVVDTFNARFAKEPDVVIRELQEMLKRDAQVEDPGPPPDLMEDPAAYQAWVVKSNTYRDWKHENALKSLKTEYEEQLGPVQQAHQNAQQAQALQGIKTSIGANDDEWGEIEALQKELSSDNLVAIRAMQELVRLRKGGAKKQAKAQEQIRGSESRPGLPRTGSRAKPKPTGDSMKDAVAELAAEGIEYPDE